MAATNPEGFVFHFMYYRFFGKWLMFGSHDVVNLLYIIVGQCTFSDRDDFVLGVVLMW